jgi:hypothetical protein
LNQVDAFEAGLSLLRRKRSDEAKDIQRHPKTKHRVGNNLLEKDSEACIILYDYMYFYG